MAYSGPGSQDDAPLLAVAGLSARALAASAQRAHLRVAALDCFGDRDTRTLAQYWMNVAAPGALAVGRDALRDALNRVAGLEGAIGWVGGGGIEPWAQEAAQLCPGLRYFGNSPRTVAAVRHPAHFFALLEDLDIPFPPVCLDLDAHPGHASGIRAGGVLDREANAERAAEVMEAPEAWLHKSASGCGGLHVLPANTVRPANAGAEGYFQRRFEGTPMSALFLADGRTAAVIGYARQAAVALGDYPYVYAGATAPIALPARLAARLASMIAALVARTGLVGLNGMDFLLHGQTPYVLEINPRPTATLPLFEAAQAGRWPRGLLALHLDACDAADAARRCASAPAVVLPPPAATKVAQPPRLPADFAPPLQDPRGGMLPDAAPPGAASPPPTLLGVAAHATVFAPHVVHVSEQLSDMLAHAVWCADIPEPGTQVEAGQPLCTVTAQAPGAVAAQRILAQHRTQIEQWLGALAGPPDGKPYVDTARLS